MSDSVLFEMPYGHSTLQMVCAETALEGLVRHTVQVTIWTLILIKFYHSVSVLWRILK